MRYLLFSFSEHEHTICLFLHLSLITVLSQTFCSLLYKIVYLLLDIFLSITTFMLHKNSTQSLSLVCRGTIDFLFIDYVSANARDLGDVGSIPGLGSSSGGRRVKLFHYSCLENPMDRATHKYIGLHRVKHN